MDVKNDGKVIPAVAVIEKDSLLYLLDRTNGKPIYGVEERPVPQSEVPLEKTSPTQPFPVKPQPLARQTMTMADIATVTPELEAACRKLVEDNHLELGGPFLPETYEPCAGQLSERNRRGELAGRRVQSAAWDITSST